MFNIEIDADRVYEAIRLGVEDAVMRIATNATDAPCADFYQSIENGVKAGMDRININVED